MAIHVDLFLVNVTVIITYPAKDCHPEVSLHGIVAKKSVFRIYAGPFSPEGITTVEIGLVATKLIQKVAISSSFSFIDATDNGNGNKFIYGNKGSKAVNYTFSFGKLMLPKEYSNYSQTNINLMLELLSQLNVGSGKYYMDLAPSVQLIFNSQSRVDIGYRKQVTSTLLRTAPNGVFIRLEYNMFNAL